MKIVFLADYLNHRQLPTCLALQNVKNVEFTYIATMPTREEGLSSAAARYVSKFRAEGVKLKPEGRGDKGGNNDCRISCFGIFYRALG